MSILKAEYSGKLNIDDIILTCAVLQDGERVLSERSIGNAIGTKAGSSYWKKKKEGKVDVPQYIAANNLRPFINEELRQKLTNSIPYISKGGTKANGLKASVLPEICDVWIKAKEAGKLTTEQEKIAKNAYILLKAFANIGIIALIDEATGYQEIRDRLALQKILDKYLLKEHAKWAKRFPDPFYQEIFRLNNWQFNPLTVKRPGVIGKYTKDIVYERLAPKILEELEKRNPKDEKGYRKTRHHQWLTEDIGHPKLQEHLTGVIALMRAAANWRLFMRLLERAFPKIGHTIPLNFPDELE